MSYIRTERTETLSAEDFASFDVVGNYTEVKDLYPDRAADDQGRPKALDWALEELKQKRSVENPRPFCIDLGCGRKSCNS
jgi:hypothetical protein